MHFSSHDLSLIVQRKSPRHHRCITTAATSLQEFPMFIHRNVPVCPSVQKTIKRLSKNWCIFNVWWLHASCNCVYEWFSWILFLLSRDVGWHSFEELVGDIITTAVVNFVEYTPLNWWVVACCWGPQQVCRRGWQRPDKSRFWWRINAGKRSFLMFFFKASI